MECLRRGELVYIAIPKHASTSYKNIFQQSRFLSITFDQINWEVDQVFSHICHPLTRHAKGVAEFICRENLYELIENSKFDKLLATCLFDTHNMPIGFTCLQPYAKNINWIPLDYPIPSYFLTTKFLKYHRIDIDCNDFPKLHENKQDSEYGIQKTTIENYIAKLQSKYLNTISYHYLFDFSLYNQTIKTLQDQPPNWLTA